MSAETYLTAEEVMRRYRLRDPRAARAIMRRAGCVRRGGRLIVQLNALLDLDQRDLIVDDGSDSIKHPSMKDQSATPRQRPTDPPTKLEPGWWRSGD